MGFAQPAAACWSLVNVGGMPRYYLAWPSNLLDEIPANFSTVIPGTKCWPMFPGGPKDEMLSNISQQHSCDDIVAKFLLVVPWKKFSANEVFVDLSK